ncbi:MAG: oligosaccharide flippase family protein [Deltaproteobacteria bacterium]|nr:oligosaccharide flippase family protein [Deltaproteobacteria bacterium]
MAGGAQRGASPSLTRRAASGAFWSVSGSVLSRLLTLAAAIFVARHLGAAAFGEYNLVLTTAGVLQALAGFGLGATAAKYLSGKYRLEPAAAGRVIGLSSVIAAGVGALATGLLALSGPWIARVVLNAPQLGGALRLGSLLLLFGSIQGAQVGVLTGLERFRLLALVSVVAAVVTAPLLVLGASQGGTLGGVVGLVVSAAVTIALFGVAVRVATRASGIRPRYRGALAEWRILFSYSLPATLSNLLLAPVTWAASAILVNQWDGLRELGLFSAANQWRNAIVFVATAIGAALLPLFSHLHDSGRSRAFLEAFWASFILIGVMCMAAAGLLAALAPVLMRSYGAEFASATTVLIVLVIAGAIAAPLSVVGNAMGGAGKMWLGFALNLAWAGALLATAYALRSWGALGLSLAYLLAYLVHLFTSLGCLRLMAREGSLKAGARAGAPIREPLSRRAGRPLGHSRAPSEWRAGRSSW